MDGEPKAQHVSEGSASERMRLTARTPQSPATTASSRLCPFTTDHTRLGWRTWSV